jgi:hypothetical protein
MIEILLVSTQKIDLHIPRNHTATTDGRPSNRHIFRDFMLHRWKRCRQLFTLVSDSIGWPLYSSDGDGTKQVVNFLAVRNNIEVARTGVALLDTGSDLDWISSEFANRLGVVFQSSSRVIIAETVTGEPVYSLGMIEGRWRCVDRPCRPRFEVSTFYIIDSPSIDIGIGKETLQRTGLYRRNSALVAAFRPHIPRAKGVLRT